MESNLKVLVVGDIMLDEYIVGDYLRDSPEDSSAKVLNYTKSETRLGGAANVANNLISLSVSSTLVSVIGDDEDGRLINRLLKEHNIEADLLVDNQRFTTKKTRFVNNDFKQFLRLDKESSQNIDSIIQKELLLRIDRQLSTQTFDAIILQDYNKGVLTPEVIKQIQRIAHERNLKIFVDPKKNHFELLSQSFLFKCNLGELSHYLNQELETSPSQLNNAIESSTLHSKATYVITLSEKGIFYKKAEEYGLIPGNKLENADVSGAGDTVIAVLVYAILSGKTIKEATQWANKAGYLVCAQKGVSTVTLNTLFKENVSQN